MKIAHIINPFYAKPGNRSYLDVAQPITFKSMVNAKNFASNSGIDVELLTCQFYDTDLAGVPNDFIKTPHFKTSILNYNTFSNKQLVLPRVCDILDNAYLNSDADYIIYTNVDIAVMPNFYKRIYNLITKKNIESIIINRVDIPKVIKGQVIGPSNIGLAYSYSGGLWHPGKDCFVFKRSIIPKMKLNNVFIGFAPIGVTVLSQIYKNTDEGRFLWIADAIPEKNRFTFHIGRDRSHLDSELLEYRKYNRIQADGLIDKQFVGKTCNKDIKKMGRVIL
jgi:hypothetical protein